MFAKFWLCAGSVWRVLYMNYLNKSSLSFLHCTAKETEPQRGKDIAHNHTASGIQTMPSDSSYCCKSLHSTAPPPPPQISDLKE